MLVEVEVAPPTRLPVGDAAADLAVIDDTGGLVGTMPAEDRVATLRETFRVLRAGGRYASMEPHGGGADWRGVLRDYGREVRMMLAIILWRPFSRLHGQLSAQRFAQLLGEAGFTEFRSEAVLHGLGIIGAAEK